jgi:hypothetical protein
MSHVENVRHEAERAHRLLGGGGDAVRCARAGTGVGQQCDPCEAGHQFLQKLGPLGD